MEQRKSLSQALETVELPQEAVAFIEAGRPRSNSERLRIPRGTEAMTTEAPRGVGSSAAVRDPIRSDSANRAHRGLVPLSVRVQSSLADSLLKVAFERKLERKEPYSQQDIVIQALTQWLRKNGHAVEDQ